MRSVFKYCFTSDKPFSLPKGAEVIRFNPMPGNASGWLLWAIVDLSAELEQRTFVVVGTGHALLNGNLKHVDTHVGDLYVWHCFERLK